MVTYGDYFSRKTLYACGVAPTLQMPVKGEKGYAGNDRNQKIRSDMQDVYQTLFDGLSKKGVPADAELARLNAERKIVCAFYDAGVLTDVERDFFQTQTLSNQDEREKIQVVEADDRAFATTASKVEPAIQEPIIGNVRR